MESGYYVYSVYDIKAQRYGPLYEAINDEVASRNFIGLMCNVEPIFRPEYRLFRIGYFDFISGELVQNEKPSEVPVVYDSTIADIRKSLEVVK